MADSNDEMTTWQKGLESYFARDYQAALSYFDEYDKNFDIEALTDDSQRMLFSLFTNKAFSAAYQANNFPRALHYASKECDLLKSQPSLYARALNNKGLALLELGRFVEAESSFNEALAVIDNIESSGIFTTEGFVEELSLAINNNLTNLSYLRNPSESAMTEFSKLASSNYIARKAGSAILSVWGADSEFAGVTIANEATAKAESAIIQGDLTSAIQIYEKAIASLGEEQNAPKAIGVLQSNLGNLLLNTGDIPNAILTLESAVASLERTPRPSEALALALHNLSAAMVKQSDTQKAIGFAKRSWLEIKEVGVNTLNTLAILYSLAFLRFLERDIQRARAALYHAIRIYDENRKYFAESERAHAGPFSTYRKIIELMLIIALHEQWSDEVLDLVESAKARYWNEHLEKLSLTAANKESEPEDSLKKDHELLKIGHQITDQRSWLINFFTGPNCTFVVSVYNGQISVRRHNIDEKQLHEEVNIFLNDIQSSSRRELWRESGKRLSSLLFEGIKIKEKKPKQIQIVPDGSLWYLPFDFLPYPEDGLGTDPSGHIFNKAPTVHIPSAKLLDQYRSTDLTGLVNKPPHLLLICKSNFSSGLPPLGSVDSEIEKIKNITANCSLNIIKESDATKENIIPQLEKANVIHIATHALANSQEELSAIILSDGMGHDVQLLASEIAELKMQAQVVFLSACSSAIGGISLGEGLTSIGRAFLMGGCKSVIASLWAVVDKEAPIFVELFYHELLGGKSPSESLRLAKQKAMERKLSIKTIASFQMYGGVNKWMTMSTFAQELLAKAEEGE